MKVRYYTLEDKKLKRAAQSKIEAAWFKGSAWDDSTDSRPLRIVTVTTTDEGEPVICHFTRVTVSDGHFTDKSISAAVDAMLTLAIPEQSEKDKKKIALQVEGWPRDWRQQLAVAMDTPIAKLESFGIGGPLTLATSMDMSVRDVIRHAQPTK